MIIIVLIEGLILQESRRKVEEKLLVVKGVVSFTFNLAIQRCYVRTRNDLKPESLCQAVSSIHPLTARQVVKNENGEEVC